ncbi:MAG: TIM barrel protein [Nitrospiraceae bacterium]|nr:TIM barrel protein [Nitrospiraceae bacterium]
MLPGINQWAFPADMPATEAISIAKKVGFKAFEVCVGAQGPVRLNVTQRDVMAIRKHAEREGIELTSIGCGLGWELPMTSPDPNVRTKGVEAVARALEIASCLGVDSVLTVPGSVTPEVSYDVAIENALNAIQDLVPTAERLKVSVAIENVWNKFLLSPVEMRDFIDQFQSEYVGAYFDVGNIILYGYPEQWIRILGNRICMVHAKDFRASAGNFGGFVMLMEGDVNWPAVMAAFREVGYDRALVAEFGPYTHSLDVMLRHVSTALEAIVAL